LGGAVVLLILFATYGFPAILNLTSQISAFRRGNMTVPADKGFTPTTPRLAENFDATNSANIKLTGVADPKVTVQLDQDDQPGDTIVAGDDGTFNFVVSLKKGDNFFTVQAVSATGVKSDKSGKYKITYLASGPKLDISSPKDQDSVKDSMLTVSGSTDPNSSVTINDHLAITRSDGAYSGSVTLSNGDNKIKVVATDRAGNQTTKEITVKYSP